MVFSEMVGGWRRDLHQRAELAFAEHATGDYVANRLQELGCVVTRGVGGTGLVATIHRPGGSGAIGFRADMDGLPLTERTASGGSVAQARMHACGHDGHMAMVLGAAALLQQDPSWSGTVRLYLQPAEEPGRGAAAMLADGLLERFPVDRVFGLHNLPGLEAGTFSTRAGAVMASEDDFEIRVRGRGGHSSAPHRTQDALVAAAAIVIALQNVVARDVDPMAAAVLSCTGFTTDGARNAIPGGVTISGDTRSFDSEVQRLLERRIREVAAGVAAAHGVTAEVEYSHEFSPTANDPTCVDISVRAAARVVGTDRVSGDGPAILASEDFGVLSAALPGCFAFIGNGVESGAGGDPLHSPEYRFNDGILEIGSRYYLEIVRELLGSGVGA